MSSSTGEGTGSAREATNASPVGVGSIDRRRVMVGLAATLLGAAGAASPAAGVSPAAALSGGGGRFDLRAPSFRFLREKRVRESTVMQSFAFDDSKGVLYVAQVMQGGRRLPGESAPVSGARRAANGDVCISRVSYTGRLLSWMYLRGFGHAVAIGVEPVGSSSYLWLETASVTRDGVGYGTAVGRVRFVPGGVVSYPSAAVQVHRPVRGAREVSVSLDALNRTLLIRCLVSGSYRYFLYGLDAFRARKYAPRYARAETGVSDVFQGHTHLFDQVYRLEGRSGGVSVAPTHISCFDLPTGRTVERRITEAAKTLTFREPEGLAVQLKPRRLHMGFADGPRGARTMSLYFKDVFKQ